MNPYSHSVLFKLGAHQTSKMQDLVLNNTSLFHQAVTLQSVSINTLQPMSSRVKSKLLELNNGNLASLKSLKENGHTMGHPSHHYHQNGSVDKKKNDGGKHDEKPPSSTESKQYQQQPCLMSPDTVRYEAQCLRTDFNLRIKQILFNSIVSAYYIGFIPLKFTQVKNFFP